jgi:hypothetical protein
MPRRNTPDHSYFDSVFTQLELRVVSLFSGVVSNVESNAASGIFPGLNVVDTGLKAGMAYHRFRYYSPETGAYISQDPIHLEAGLTNLYVYLHDVNAWVDPWGLKGKAWFNYAKRWHDKRADEIFGVGKGRSVSGRHYDKTYKGRDIEFKSDNFSKGPRSKESLERMQKQLNKDIQNKKRELLILIGILSMTQVLFLRCKIY